MPAGRAWHGGAELWDWGKSCGGGGDMKCVRIGDRNGGGMGTKGGGGVLLSVAQEFQTTKPPYSALSCTYNPHRNVSPGSRATQCALNAIRIPESVAHVPIKPW